MKLFVFSIWLFVSTSLIAQSISSPIVHKNKVSAVDKTATVATEQIKWMTWEEAYKANKEEPKKIFIDIYTHWCGWCKKMDKSTFLDATIVKELNDNFYAVKFDAEQKDDIDFNGAKFSFVGQGNRGTHQLAYALLDGRMGYPAFVMLDESFNRIMLAPGYKRPNELITQLKYSSTESYKKKNFKDFEANFKTEIESMNK